MTVLKEFEYNKGKQLVRVLSFGWGKSNLSSPGVRLSSARLVLFLLLSMLAVTADGKSEKHGFIDFNFYPYLSDVDSDNSFTLNLAADMEHRFSYFSLTNYAHQEGAGELEETNAYYSEQNLRWQIAEDSPLDLTWQSNFRTGNDNDRHRLGLRWRLNDTGGLHSFFDTINLKYAINFHLIQFDHDPNHVWQMEHSFFLTLPELSERLYLAGFIDHTFNETLPPEIPSNPAVMEAQLGYRIYNSFFLIAEWRLNQYRRADVNNLGVGIQYKINW